MAWTALNYQKPGAQVWRESYERKIIFDTRDTQIYCQKARKPGRQSESRRPQDLQEGSRIFSISDKAQQI